MTEMNAALWYTAASILVLWVVAVAKKSRPDGTYIKRVHPYRRLMWHIMPTRNESICYLDFEVPAAGMLAYLKKARPKFGANVTHLAVASLNLVLARSPEMNRFVVGKRLYQRKERIFSFSMKRKRLDAKSKIAIVHTPIPDEETFAHLCERINDKIDHQRSGKKTGTDIEYGLFNLLPRPVLSAAVALMRWLDAHNLLPGFFIRGDALYASGFIANLGSLGMAPVYHHLYEWGTCSWFVTVGRVEKGPILRGGELVIDRKFQIRAAYDERIDDGLTARAGLEDFIAMLTDPEPWFGCVAEDGSDDLPMVQLAEAFSGEFDQAAAELSGRRFLSAVIETSFDLGDYDYNRKTDHTREVVAASVSELLATLGSGADRDD